MTTKQTFLRREARFITLIVLFIIASVMFYDRPQIAMWLGFAFAGYSAIANDSIQTLGTFISSNRKVKWWMMTRER